MADFEYDGATNDGMADERRRREEDDLAQQQLAAMTPAPISTPAVTPAAAPAAKPAWGSYMPEGYDPQKIASGHDSPKYQVGRTVSQFDPSAGLTPEVIAALNNLGIGDFSAIDGDKLRVTGNMDPRFEGVTEFDMIRAFSGGPNGEGRDPHWGWGAIGGPNFKPEGATGKMLSLLPQSAAVGAEQQVDPSRLDNQALTALMAPPDANAEALARQQQLAPARPKGQPFAPRGQGSGVSAAQSPAVQAALASINTPSTRLARPRTADELDRQALVGQMAGA